MKDILIWEDLVQNRGFYQVLITIGLVFLYLLSVRLVRKITRHRAARQNFHANRVLYVTKFLNFLILVVFALAIALIWDVSFRGLAIYFASFFTVAGVALFANWSILSNITASVLLYFYFPYKIGSRVTIMDGDNSVKRHR